MAVKRALLVVMVAVGIVVVHSTVVVMQAEELVYVEVDATAPEDALKAVVVVGVDDTTSPISVLKAVDAPETITLARFRS